ncbi:MAG: 6-phosphofructokinase, partial [Oscillospiraceae bacterium]|nr:6-phosphofructokinase [Oscillospiraceae bacterium]
LLQRCGAHLASATDLQEAEMAGRVAVEKAVEGVTDKMVAFECSRDGGYVCSPKLIPLADVANYERKVPREWIVPEGNNVNEGFINYCLPLIQGQPDRPTEQSLPRYAKLKKVLAK